MKAIDLCIFEKRHYLKTSQIFQVNYQQVPENKSFAVDTSGKTDLAQQQWAAISAYDHNLIDACVATSHSRSLPWAK